MSVRNLATFLLFACCAAPLQAGFVGETCISSVTCFNSNTSTSASQGSTTFTFLESFSGQLVNAKPTLGTFDQLTVDNPNGVPVLGSTQITSAGSSFTDTVTVGTVASNYAFNFNFHVINSSNSFPDGFDVVSSTLLFNVVGRDQFGNILWHTTTFSWAPQVASLGGPTTTSVTYNTGNTFYSPLLKSMDLSLGLTSSVNYSNYSFFNPAGRTNATHVSAFSDASNTVTLQSIVAKDSTGTPTGDPIIGLNGANYSTNALPAVPEPGSVGLALGGVLSLLVGRRRK